MKNSSRILIGDVRAKLGELETASIDCVVTSPPFWGLRDYGTSEWEGGEEGCQHRTGDQVVQTFHGENDTVGSGVRPGSDNSHCSKCGAVRVDSQIGLEASPDLFVDALVEVFRGVARVLKTTGTLWLNLGDSYVGSGPMNTGGGHGPNSVLAGGKKGEFGKNQKRVGSVDSIKPKNLCGIPWRVAFALQADGWYLRQEIIWSKPNPMPESVRDRCTKSHESIFLLAHPESKGKYYYDADAVREPHQDVNRPHGFRGKDGIGQRRENQGWATGKVSLDKHREYNPNGRNKRSVWTITTKPYKHAHFATFPPELPRTCILAGTSEKGVCPDCGKPWCRDVESSGGNWQERKARGAGRGTLSTGANTNHGIGMSHDLDPPTRITLGWQPQCDCGSDPVPATVLDPFAGAGTTLLEANRLQRDAIGIELNPEYAKLMDDRIYEDAPLFTEVDVL